MIYTIQSNAIKTTTELLRNFTNIREDIKNGLDVIVFKNSKPDLAVIDINKYQQLQNLYEILEDEAIARIIANRDEQRKNMPDRKMYSLDEVKSMFANEDETESYTTTL